MSAAPLQRKPLYVPQTLSEFVQKPQASMLVAGIVPLASIIVVFGEPKCGKTFVVTDMTMHGAHGVEWHGRTVVRPLRVVYLAGEGTSGLKVRLKAWQELHDSLDADAKFWVIPHSVPLPDAAQILAEDLKDCKPDIIVCDTLNTHFGGGDESKTMDMTGFCDALRVLVGILKVSVIVIHHTGHGDKNRERGSTVLRASADVVVQVAKDAKTKGLIGVQVIAARDMEEWDQPLGLRLARHETEWMDDDRNPMVTCTVQGTDEPVCLPGRGGKPLGPVQAVLLAAAKTLAKGRSADQDGKVILARQDIVAAACEAHGGKLDRRSVSSAWPALEERGLIRRIEPACIAILVLR